MFQSWLSNLNQILRTITTALLNWAAEHGIFFFSFSNKCYYKYKWNRQVATLFNTRVSCIYTIFMKVKCFCGGGKTTASKYSPKDTQASRCLQIVKNKHKKTAMKDPPKISSRKSTSSWKSTSTSHLSGLEDYSSLRFKIWLLWVPFPLKHWKLVVAIEPR